jgi:ADP-dependent NAD(P)H-hydrate dehydratase / NAD(P)H-hydrate epimerase
MKISKVGEMRGMDRAAIDRFGIPDEILMENAGLAAVRVLLRQKSLNGKKVLILCGIGNNGGDGLVVARHLYSHGVIVKVFLLGDPVQFKGPAKLNYEILIRLPVEAIRIEKADKLKNDLANCDAVVDAIFGTGLGRPVEGLQREIIEMVNASGKYILSLDIPSGVNGDTGQVMGAAIRADSTVSFGLPKVGNLLFPGYSLGGELFISHISFPPELYSSVELKLEVNDPLLLPIRKPDGHKGDFGEALFIGGASSYFGAPYFSALSFLKAGGGYSRLACPKSITPFIANKGSEIVFLPQNETSNGSLSLDNKAGVLEISTKMDFIVLGPGLSLNPESQHLARELIAEIQKPLLIDGDGLTALSQEMDIILSRKTPTILTPHLGEMSRLSRIPISEIESNLIEIVQQKAHDWNTIIVLKGAHTLIGYPDQRLYINMSGNSGMGTAGSGDVLTGTIAAMAGLGLSIGDAVRQGVFVHGLAGDLASEQIGQDGMTAQDILNYLPSAVKLMRDDFTSIVNRYSIPAF